MCVGGVGVKPGSQYIFNNATLFAKRTAQSKDCGTLQDCSVSGLRHRVAHTGEEKQCT